MSVSRMLLLAVGAAALMAAAPAQAVPDFSSGEAAWIHPPGGEFPSVSGSPTPLRKDPAHPYVGNGPGKQPTYRLGDVSNPNRKPGVKDAMKKDNQEFLAGKIAFPPRSGFFPAGTPEFTLFGGP